MAHLGGFRYDFITLDICYVRTVEGLERERCIHIGTAVLFTLAHESTSYAGRTTIVAVALTLLKPKSNRTDMRHALSPRRIQIFSTGGFCTSKLRHRALQVTGCTSHSVALTLAFCVGTVPRRFRSLVQISDAEVFPVSVARFRHRSIVLGL